MEFLGANSGAGLAGSGASSSRWSGTFGAQSCSVHYVLGTTDLLKQVEQLIEAAEKKRIS